MTLKSRYDTVELKICLVSRYSEHVVNDTDKLIYTCCLCM